VGLSDMGLRRPIGVEGAALGLPAVLAHLGLPGSMWEERGTLGRIGAVWDLGLPGWTCVEQSALGRPAGWAHLGLLAECRLREQPWGGLAPSRTWGCLIQSGLREQPHGEAWRRLALGIARHDLGSEQPRRRPGAVSDLQLSGSIWEERAALGSLAPCRTWGFPARSKWSKLPCGGQAPPWTRCFLARSEWSKLPWGDMGPSGAWDARLGLGRCAVPSCRCGDLRRAGVFCAEEAYGGRIVQVHRLRCLVHSSRSGSALERRSLV
jgi:hypothetical protein